MAATSCRSSTASQPVRAGRQREAAETALRRRFAVIAGGPGTGKTTTVARILALLLEQPATAAGRARRADRQGRRAAAARPSHEEAAKLDVAEPVRERLLRLEASTLHRLLGWRPGTRSRFRHDRGNRLPHDVVIVDETSMVSLSLMARLVEAVRADARLILVGDPGQLASIEAGAVLGDIVGPGGRRGSSCSSASTATAAGSPSWPRRSGAATATAVELLAATARRDLDRRRRRSIPCARPPLRAAARA